jgi:hypothetical protein
MVLWATYDTHRGHAPGRAVSTQTLRPETATQAEQKEQEGGRGGGGGHRIRGGKTTLQHSPPFHGHQGTQACLQGLHPVLLPAVLAYQVVEAALVEGTTYERQVNCPCRL